MSDQTILTELVASTRDPEMGLEAMVRAIADALSAALGRPAGVLLSEGEPPGLVIASGQEVGRGVRRSLRRLARPSCRVTRALVARPELAFYPLNTEGGRWFLVPVWRRGAPESSGDGVAERLLGALLVQAQDGDAEPFALLGLPAELSPGLDRVLRQKLEQDVADYRRRFGDGENVELRGLEAALGAFDRPHVAWSSDDEDDDPGEDGPGAAWGPERYIY